MPNLSPIPSAIREAQATACLEAAATHRELLLAVACKLAGSEEGGMELFQQACLNCHDAIQHKGYDGVEFRFYLRKAIKNLHLRQQQQARLYQGLDGLEESRDASPATDARGHLADQMKQEVCAHFDGADRLALRLHLDGMSYREIAAHVGGDFTWIGKRVAKIKNHLRATFGRAWANLDSE